MVDLPSSARIPAVSIKGVICLLEGVWDNRLREWAYIGFPANPLFRTHKKINWLNFIVLVYVFTHKLIYVILKF